MYTTILVACISAVAAVGIYAVVTNLVAKTSIRKRREAALKEAEAEGEMIKKEKILQAKEKFIQLKSEYDRQVNERNQKIAQSEQRAKQIEGNLQNQQRELENKLRENERLKEQMQNQLQILEHKKEEVDQMMREQNMRLEQISGMSSEDAKNILIENMKAEAKTEAASYVNETIEEAKMTATKEAKRIIVASIQRVATETAIENAVTVFNIESDEVKGRIIGREGRNIRALEAATGIEIIVDDTPEAIILSGFAPPVGNRRPHPPGTHRGGRSQSTETDRRGDRRSRKTHHDRPRHPRAAPRADPHDRQNEIPFVLRPEPPAARP